ncbi:MAG: RNA polymerase sigma factor [Thalassotalea sp.]
MKNNDDKKLVALAQSGSINAFTELVKRYERDVRSFLAVRLHNNYEADDLAQETFIVAFNKLNDFEQNRPFRPWLKGIAFNLLKNYWRKHRTVLIGSNEELEMLIDEKIHQSFTDDKDAESLSALETCVESLDVETKSLLNQHYVNDVSVGNLTKEYEVGHSTMTMRLHRIRAKLKDCISLKLTVNNS